MQCAVGWVQSSVLPLPCLLLCLLLLLCASCCALLLCCACRHMHAALSCKLSIMHAASAASHSFLEESAVYLADEPMSDVEAMIWVQVRRGPAGMACALAARSHAQAAPLPCH